VAVKGDWIVGLGSRNAPSGDLSDRLVYTMLVEEAISLADYDRRAPDERPRRVPDLLSRDLADRLGDCIYNYSAGNPPEQRASVHSEENRKADLGGVNVLLSRDFYYFGSKAIPLPSHLLPICHQTQGHKSTANNDYLGPFVHWIRGLGLGGGQIYGWPDHVIDWTRERIDCGCGPRAEERPDDPVC
jgi:hypothetical protein